jgi:DNA invertase Pin-like site-specific DNA recombinase
MGRRSRRRSFGFWRARFRRPWRRGDLDLCVYVAKLMVHQVPFIVAELGSDVDRFMLHIYAAVAEKERKLISQRTRDALKAAQARGTVLGKPRLDERPRAVTALKSEADRFARNVGPIIAEITRGGVTSARGIAKALNAAAWRRHGAEHGRLSRSFRSSRGSPH